MYFDFSNMWPNGAQKGSVLNLIDQKINKHSKELRDFHEGRSYLSISEAERIGKKITSLHAQKQAEEIKMLVNLELLAYKGHLAMLDPTTTA